MPDKKINVDFLSRNSSQGEVAGQIMANGRLNIGRLRPFIGRDGRSYIASYLGGNPRDRKNYKVMPINANATLRRDEWKQLDEAVLAISDYRLGGIQDLISAGLTYDLGNAMGTTVLEWHDVSDAMEADLTMDGVTRSVGDRPSYTTNYLPIPIIHVDYEINARVLEASRSLGNPLDTTTAERAARRVNEKLENMLFTNTTYAFGGGTIYSYLNHPNRNTGTFTGWTASGASSSTILQDVRDMKQSSINARHYGPWVLYIPTEYETTLDEDYDATTPGTTIRERILKIGGIREVRVSDTLADGNLLLVQMSSDVVRLVRGMGIQNVEWMTEGNMITKYKVMTIQVPQIRSDQAGRSGITHYSTS
jgi:hypothetical protein